MAKKRANGEGNIRKRADGRWEGRYTAGYHPETGKRMLGHYDAGFTLRTYTHATRQMQQKAAEKMGSFMAQIR